MTVGVPETNLDRFTVLKTILVQNRYIVFSESILMMILAWALIAHLFGISDVISTPTAIGSRMFVLIVSGEFITHLVPTLTRTAYGLFLSAVIGTVFGVGMAMNRFTEKAFQDYITVGLAMPGLFIAVFTAMWFGVSDLTPAVAATLIAFPFLAQNVHQGMKNVDNNLLQMARSFGISRKRVLRQVILPSILPEWFAGIRYALVLVWKIVTLAELVGAENGVGYILRQKLELLDFTGSMAWTVLFVAVVIVIEYGILQRVEKYAFEWREDISEVITA